MKAPATGGGPGRAETSSRQPKSTACTAEEPARPSFTVTLRPEPGVDGHRALRALLKAAKRLHALTCIACQEEPVG
jgi:hypothetical protein